MRRVKSLQSVRSSKQIVINARLSISFLVSNWKFIDLWELSGSAPVQKILRNAVSDQQSTMTFIPLKSHPNTIFSKSRIVFGICAASNGFTLNKLYSLTESESDKIIIK